MSGSNIKEWIEQNPLRQWRKENELSITIAASVLGVNKNTIVSWEHGAATPSQWDKLKEVLGEDIQQRWEEWRNSR